MSRDERRAKRAAAAGSMTLEEFQNDMDKGAKADVRKYLKLFAPMVREVRSK